MTFTSIGYAGTISAANWATAAPSLGVQYSILGANDLRPTVASGDRRVSFAAGTAFGRGITDTHVADAAATKSFDIQASGVRYDTVVIRRHWANKTSTLEVVKGTATKAIAAARNVTPGVVDDQPIALIRITAGSTVPVIEADLRCWDANGGMAALDVLALSFLDRPGAHVRIGVDEWVMQRTGTSWGWVKEEPQSVLSLPQGKEPTLLGSRGTRPLLVQGGTKVLVSDANGFCQFEWGTPFPNGLVSLSLTNGDGGGPLRDLTPVVAGSLWPYAGNKRYGDRTGVVYLLQRMSDAAIIPKTQHRTNWIAIGF